MGIYVFLLLFCLFASFFLKGSKKFGVFIIFVLFLLSAGRGESVGNDTVSYYNNVFSSNDAGVIHKFEFVFIGLCDLIRDNGLNPRCCIYLLSFVTFFFLFLSAKRFRVSSVAVCFFYLLFLYYTYSIHIARQMAACSILLYAYSFLYLDEKSIKRKKNKNIRNILFFGLFALLATSFHSGAFLGFPVLFIYLLRAKISNLFYHIHFSPTLLFLVFFILFGFTQLLRSVLLSRFQGLLTAIDMYEGYTTEERAISLFGFLYSSIVYYFHAFIVVYLFKNGNDKLGGFFLCTILLRIGLSAFNGVIYRLSFYYSVIDIIVYSVCFFYLIKKRKMLFCLMLLYFGMDYVLVLVNNTYETVPYVFKMIELL